MESFIKLLTDRKRPLIRLVEKWRWVGILFASLGLLGLEIYEFINRSLHPVEVILYAMLLFGIGLLLELIVRSNRGNEKLLKTLEYRHDLSLELFLNDDLESLITKMVELPGKITEVGETYLLIRNPVNDQFDVAGHWKSAEQNDGEWNPMYLCQKCLEKSPFTYNFHLCQDSERSSQKIYSLGIANANYPATIIRFKMRSGAQLQHEEEKIFKNIADAIAVALRSSQDRKRLLEMRAAEMAMAERSMIVDYVHDQLGQNLEQLQLRLDQLGANENISKVRPVRDELKHLRDVANQSYRIVRDVLKNMQSNSNRNLADLLKEYAGLVSERAKLTLDFNSVGQPVELSSETQQIIFSAFSEILNNIEKHSSADRVDVQIVWGVDVLNISVADNGIGFQTGSIQKGERFGLEIVNERISYLNGQLRVDSASDTGTVISISVPTKPMKRVTL